MKKILISIACILSSALLFYFSDGLSGHYGFLQWLAPVPLFILSFYIKYGLAFVISFAASFLGRIGWLSYLGSVMPLVPALIVISILSFVFAGIIVLSRHIVSKTNAWFSVFAFPVLFTTFEWLLTTLSYDGTAASIAYSQSDLLFVAQIASVTGILGITFTVTFIASFISLIIYFRKNKSQLIPLGITGLLIIVFVFGFGFVRLKANRNVDRIPAGLVSLDENQHKFEITDNQFEINHAENYVSAISQLAVKGAGLVVLPERALNINKEIDSTIRNLLGKTARNFHISIIAGYTNYLNDQPLNSAFVIGETGNVILEYNKVHLVKGLERQFATGKETGIFSLAGMQGGVAICKDLDYPDYIKQYSREGISILCVPAWDFGVDGWLHSRMAIMRGIENGFSQIRTARTGRLTISDAYGRVTAEANAENGKAMVLSGYVSTNRIQTLFSRTDIEWLGIFCAVASLFFILWGYFKKS